MDYEELPAAHGAAVRPGAPQLWRQTSGALDWEHGDAAAVDAAFAKRAAHMVSVRSRTPAWRPSALEPRAAIGAWDEASGRYTLTAATQGVAVVRKVLAEAVFKLPAEKIRVLTTT